MSRRGKDSAHADAGRRGGEALPSQVECLHRCLCLRARTRHPVRTSQKSLPLLSGSRRVHDCHRGHGFPPLPRLLSPLRLSGQSTRTASEPHPLGGLDGLTSRGARRLPCLCSTFCRVQSPLCRATVRGFVLPEGSAPPRQFTTVVTDSESIRLPRRTGAKTSAMFGAGEEDDTDFLSPSGG